MPQPGADCRVRDRVQQSKPTEFAALRICRERNGSGQLNVAHPDLIDLEDLCGNVCECFAVEPVFERGDGRGNSPRATFQGIRTTLEHWLLVLPDNRRLKLRCNIGRVL